MKVNANAASPKLNGLLMIHPLLICPLHNDGCLTRSCTLFFSPGRRKHKMTCLLRADKQVHRAGAGAGSLTSSNQFSAPVSACRLRQARPGQIDDSARCPRLEPDILHNSETPPHFPIEHRRSLHKILKSHVWDYHVREIDTLGWGRDRICISSNITHIRIRLCEGLENGNIELFASITFFSPTRARSLYSVYLRRCLDSCVYVWTTSRVSRLARQHSPGAVFRFLGGSL